MIVKLEVLMVGVGSQVGFVPNLAGSVREPRASRPYEDPELHSCPRRIEVPTN